MDIAGITLKNPVMPASGIFGSGQEYSGFVDLNRLGAVVTKGVSLVPWEGNPTPRIMETASGMINAVGLQNPGIEAFIGRNLPFLRQFDTKVIVNVCGSTVADYLGAVERLSVQGIDMLEINISCPNVEHGGIAFGQEPRMVEYTVGTANFWNPCAMPEIIGGLEKYMEENGIRDLKEISRYYRNAKRVFFTGANPFVLSFDKLKTLAELVRKYYPKVQSIGCFARITDITPKTTEQLRELRGLGYNSLTIGVEAGDEESLSFMHKGFGTKEIIEECKRLDEAGMDYNFFYLAGIYGSGHMEEGVKNTAEVFNQLHPKVIVSSMLTIYPTSELYQEIQAGNWTEETEIEKLYELRTLIEKLSIDTYFATMGASNCINVEGHLPKDRGRMVKWLDEVIGAVDEKELRRYRENLRHL